MINKIKNMKKKLVIILTIILLILVITPNINAISLPADINAVTTGPSSNALVSYGDGDQRFWHYFYGNAQEYYKVWCDNIQSGAFDNKSISYVIRTYNISYFYVIAHSNGSSNQFQLRENVFYTADELREDMKDRPPVKLAIICCCEGMTDTGPGSISYEVRKGQLNDTITIGYTNMNEYAENNGSMWNLLDWQDILFMYINRGYTVKKAFDLACFFHPELENYVKFVGDEDLRIKNLTFSPPKSTDRNIYPLKNRNKTILPLFNQFLEKILLINKKISIKNLNII